MTGPSRRSLTALAHRVEESQAGRTLASVLREIVPETSWNRARQLCAEGAVRVDGETAIDPVRRLVAGEEISLGFAGGPSREERAPKGTAGGWSAGDVAVLHCDADLVVVRKPAGLLTVPFERDDRDTLLALTRVAVRRLEAAQGRTSAGSGSMGKKGSGATLRAVQRLDKETSGLVVFARSVAAQRDLQTQLTEHTMERRYLALVHGAAEPAVYDTLLLPDRGDGLKGSWGRYRPARGREPEEGKRAVTGVSVVERIGSAATLVACELETGRQHQIRIHLAEAGHPVIGETVYVRDYKGKWIDAPRLMLHAAGLGFLHPRTTRHLRFEDPLPEEFRALMKRLRAVRAGKAGASPG
jgi:23S rRNA pseudouridine1911/1915/1917 synthase